MKNLYLLIFAIVFTFACSGDDATSAPVVSKEEIAKRKLAGKADESVDQCEEEGWYGDGFCEWFCAQPDPDCKRQPFGEDPSTRPTFFPIILLHGYFSSATKPDNFKGVGEALKAQGNAVFFSDVPPFNTAERRAEFLSDFIDGVLAETGAEKVNLIAHSMGGLDARYLISKNGLARHADIASLTTIATPHRGTKLADVTAQAIPDSWNDFINALLEIYGKEFSLVGEGETNIRGALASLSVAEAPQFNLLHEDVRGVYYQSYAGISSITGLPNGFAARHCESKLLMHEGTYARTSPVFWVVVPIIADVGIGPSSTDPNDGLIPVSSAKWGNFRGCLPADHVNIVDQPDGDGYTGYDSVHRLRIIVADLAERGF